MANTHTTRRTPAPGTSRERAHWDQGRCVAGLDEVGRGAWAGPLTVGAVVLAPDRRVNGVRDSKILTASERERVAERLQRRAVSVAIGHASQLEIDQFGLSAALRLAASRALDALAVEPDTLLLDGNWDFAHDRGTVNETIVRGDARSSSIAAASIVAKVARDRLLVAADTTHPGYSFASNKGYPTPEHRRALAELGPCELHRRSWRPIAQLLEPRLFDDEDLQAAHP